MSGMDMSDRADRISDARAELPLDWQPLLTAVANAPDHGRRITLCEEFLAPQWAEIAGRNPGWVHLIRDAWQRPAVMAALGELNWTHRHFQRCARELTGLRPVEIERMLRLERALLDVRDGRASRVEAATAHGYADQPHFTREVRAFYRRTSGELMRRLADPDADDDWLLRM